VSQPFDFERLVELCRHTHEETRRSAARAVDRSLVVRNWLFGWYIVEYEQRGADRAEYGAQALRKLSAALQERIGRGFSVRYLRQFRRFYVEFKEVVPEFERRRTAFSVSVTEKIRQTLFSELPVSHGEESGASVPVLLLQRFPLGWSHYVTLLSVTDPEARRFYEIEAADNGWSVRLLRCYVLIDLKTGKLTHQDLGQMQMYVNYFDRYVKTDDELPTVGILLCDRTNDAVVELTLPEDANIYASKYQLYLPSREELADQVARVRREIEAWGGRGDG